VQHARVLNWVDVDEARWPEVRCTFLGAPGDDQFGVLFDRLAFYLRRQERHAYIIDLQAVELLPSPQRRASFFQVLRPHEFLIGSFVAGVAFVLPPTTLAFARSTMLLTRSALAPGTIVDSVEAAQAWCALRLATKAKRASARRHPSE
jgi:hypothetical protein